MGIFLRDSFAMPEHEYSKLGVLKARRLKANTSEYRCQNKGSPGKAVTLKRSPPAAEPIVTPRLAAAVCLPSSHPCALPALLEIQ